MWWEELNIPLVKKLNKSQEHLGRLEINGYSFWIRKIWSFAIWNHLEKEGEVHQQMYMSDFVEHNNNLNIYSVSPISTVRIKQKGFLALMKETCILITRSSGVLFIFHSTLYWSCVCNQRPRSHSKRTISARKVEQDRHSWFINRWIDHWSCMFTNESVPVSHVRCR